MNVTGLTRLIPTECEVGGWPPLSVTFQTEEDRKEVLSRSGSLTGDRRSNVQITEDMSRQDRQGWCELQRFMLRVMDRLVESLHQKLNTMLLQYQVPPESGQAQQGQADGGRPGVRLGPVVRQGGGAAPRHHPHPGGGPHRHQRERPQVRGVTRIEV